MNPARALSNGLTMQSKISIALTVVLVMATWNLSIAAQDLRAEIGEKYVSREIADLRFQRIDEKLDDILAELEGLNGRIEALEADR